MLCIVTKSQSEFVTYTVKNKIEGAMRVYDPDHLRGLKNVNLVFLPRTFKEFSPAQVYEFVRISIFSHI